jgi:polyhydroxyalkanoate synthesis regulator phasin
MTEEYINKKKLLEDIRRAACRSGLGETTEPYLDWKDVVSFIVDAPVVEADIDELKKEVADLNNRRHLIWALGVDYDGCNTVESLKELIDELVSYTQLPREQVPDITLRTGRWQFAGDGIVECSLCEETYDVTVLPRNYCPNCGAKMKVNI